MSERGDYHKEYRRRNTSENWAVWLYRRSVKRAKEKCMTHDLTPEFFEALWTKQKGRCHYTKAHMTRTLGDLFLASPDRIDSSLGYTQDNVVLTTVLFNLGTRDATPEEKIEAGKRLRRELRKPLKDSTILKGLQTLVDPRQLEMFNGG